MGRVETRRFFEEAAAYLTDFVGKENVVSAMVHMDEKTPHMHFLHVPVTQDGRLSASSIYTRASLKKTANRLAELPAKSRLRDSARRRAEAGGSESIWIRGVQAATGEPRWSAARKSDSVARAAPATHRRNDRRRKQEEVLQERLQSMEQQAVRAEAILSDMPELPQASLLNYKSVLKQAQTIMTQQQKSLAEKKHARCRQRHIAGRKQNAGKTAAKTFKTAFSAQGAVCTGAGSQYPQHAQPDATGAGLSG